MRAKRNAGLWSGGSVLAVVISAGLATPAAYASGGGNVFSNKFLNMYCQTAQKTIAQTPLKSTNVVYEDLGSPGIPFPPPGVPATAFIGSDALPYDGAENLPLTTTQYVGFGELPNGKDYAQAVMCKMKSAEALDFYYPGSATPGNNCAAVSEDVAGRVIAALSDEDDSDSDSDDGAGDDSDDGFTVPVIVHENWATYTGAQWTNSSPAPVAYVSTADGLLHLVGKELFVARADPSPFVGKPKKGVHYCQTIAPKYLKKLLQGKVQAPTCDPPPQYSPPMGQPQAPLPWNCQNP